METAASWLLVALDGLFVARCDTVDPIDLPLAMRIVDETPEQILGQLVEPTRVASGSASG